MRSLGRTELHKQAKALEKAGLVNVNWSGVFDEIKSIDVPIKCMDKLCKQEGVENPREIIARQRKEVEEYRQKASQEWILPYYDMLLAKLNGGNFLTESENTTFFHCLNEVVREKESVWKNRFSNRILSRPKIFRDKYECKIVSVLKEYSPHIDVEMTADEVLAEHGIQSYSQQLELKGSLQYLMNKEKQFGTEEKTLGDVINAQTLMASKPVSLNGVKKIMTIENKANYEEMKFDPEVLYIYCHGFFSPKERRFLEHLPDIAGDEVTWYHWGDMDLGGIRIYNFIKRKLFPGLQPYRMSGNVYKEVLKYEEGYELEANKIQSLKELDAGDLEDLKQCLIEYRRGIEQEAFLS